MMRHLLIRCRGLVHIKRQHYTLSSFDKFIVPQSLIAQIPASPRDSSRLMVIHRSTGQIEHRTFVDFSSILDTNYFIVMNNTRVINCKVTCRVKDDGREVITYLLKQQDDFTWLVSGDEVFDSLPDFSQVNMQSNGTNIVGTVSTFHGLKQMSFQAENSLKSISDLLSNISTIPLPPYVTSQDGSDGYQTVYAKYDGSVAAPTAGLHFTQRVFDNLDARGVVREELTLHVGYGTFGHVEQQDLTAHNMHAENFHLSANTAASINAQCAAGKRLLAVGTTSTRVLESCAVPCSSGSSSARMTDVKESHTIVAGEGSTNIFIYPPYRFKVVDALLTNFHMPGLTPIMLVSAFAGYDLTMHAYDQAVKEKYRFASFGDSMLIL